MGDRIEQTAESAQRGHVLVIEPDAAYAERFPDAPVKYRWRIECANTDLCGGFQECPESHQIDGEPVNDGPWESDESAPWYEQDYFTFHGVEHEWHYGWNWTVPFEGCVVKANAEDQPIWPMRTGRWQVDDEWDSGEFVTLHVLSEISPSPGATT